MVPMQATQQMQPTTQVAVGRIGRQWARDLLENNPTLYHDLEQNGTLGARAAKIETQYRDRVVFLTRAGENPLTAQNEAMREIVLQTTLPDFPTTSD